MYKPSKQKTRVNGMPASSKNQTILSDKPRTRGSRGKRRGGRSSVSGITSVPFVYLYPWTVGGSAAASTLFNPSVIPTVTQVAAVYQNFRFTRFHAYLLPLNAITVGSGSSDDFYAVGSSTDVSAGIAGITTLAQVTQCAPSAMQAISGAIGTPPGVTLPCAHLRLNRKFLLSNASLKWFKCIGDADTNAWENFQFQLIIYNPAAGNVTFQLLLSGVCEFCSPIPTQLTSTLRMVQDTARQGTGGLARLTAKQEELAVNLPVMEDQLDRSRSVQAVYERSVRAPENYAPGRVDPPQYCYVNNDPVVTRVVDVSQTIEELERDINKLKVREKDETLKLLNRALREK